MLTHGGDRVGFAERYGSAPLDFSVNTNPFGLSPKAREALSRAAERSCEYPDPLYRRLRGAIAAHEGVTAEQVVCGNGAADLIWRLAFALRPRRALVLAPTFSEYETALSAVECEVKRHVLRPEQGFRPTERLLDEVTEELDLVFLCNPNNPTGLTADPSLLLRLLERCRACGVLLAVDECFLGFLPNAGERTMKPWLGQYQNLLLFKAFTKLYGMAGLRLGYCLSGNERLLNRLAAAGQCWPVSVAAEEAGLAALEDTAFVEKTLAFLPPERKRLRRVLEELGLTVWPGEANYLFFQTENTCFQERLGNQGILIRSCGNYPGLDGSYYRAAVLTPEKNDRLLAAVRKIKEGLA